MGVLVVRRGEPRQRQTMRVRRTGQESEKGRL